MMNSEKVQETIQLLREAADRLEESRTELAEWDANKQLSSRDKTEFNMRRKRIGAQMANVESLIRGALEPVESHW